jgi:hypothetical protein
MKADQEPQAVFASCASAAAVLPTGFFLAPLAIPCDTALLDSALGHALFHGFPDRFFYSFCGLLLALSFAIVEPSNEILSRNWELYMGFLSLFPPRASPLCA